MATIPIEVIVQDGPSPEPTPIPSDSGETNIVVPDTGAGTIENGSNGGGIGSATGIILPAILLVLAIGSIVAILIHKYHKQKKDKTSKKEKVAMATISTIAVLAATVLISNLVIPATKAATGDIADGITPSEDKISITVTRDGGVAEASVESTATITSTSDFGYKVLLSMAEGVETSNLYLDGDTTSEHYIAAAESTELTDNTWGYALTEDGEYSAIPLLANTATVAQGDESVEDELLSIYYGVKVSSDLPAGTYSGGEIEYSLQASTGFSDSLVYMQDMTSEICAAAPTPGNKVTDPAPTATLEDIRDHNTYTIAKLADGKCWMTQNLDLDLKTDGTITYNSTNTNLTVAGSGAYENGYTTENGIITWTPANATIDFTGGTVEGWQSSNTAPYSANPDDVYYYTSGTDEPDTTYDSLELCMKDHTAEDCKHYHAGNYYNWSAAAASNDSSSLTTQYDNAANSICPAGWRLPTSRQGSGDLLDGNEQGTMVYTYNGILGTVQNCGASTCNYAQYLAGGLNIIRKNPFWLVRSGQVSNGNIVGIAVDGYYLPSTYRYASSSLYLSVGSTMMVLSDNISRAQGSSVRCVAE